VVSAVVERMIIRSVLLFKRRCVSIARQAGGQLTNDAIRFREVRLIESDGNMVGVVPIAEARKRAEDQDLDLVLIANNQDNPVCRIMDYGKFLFEKSKREKEARKSQKVTEIKEIQMRLTTEDHDLNVKTKNANRFLMEGDRVKVLIKYRGREMAYQSQGYAVMEKFALACAEYGQIDRAPRVEGRNMVMFLAPKKN
jgi:translation initiation factor IF-3